MREIVFRGKRIDNGEWVDGHLAAYDLIAPDYPEDTYNATGEYCGQTPYVGFIGVYAATIGQYTGLKDCRGERIFEGDILRPVWGNEYFLVGWRDEYADFDLVNCTGVSLPSDHDRMEIVGTIHDNPELMKGGAGNGEND